QADAKNKADELKDKAQAEADKAEDNANDAKAQAEDKLNAVKEEAPVQTEKAEEHAKEAKEKADELKAHVKDEAALLREAKEMPQEKAFNKIEISGITLDLTQGHKSKAMEGYKDLEYNRDISTRYIDGYESAVFGYAFDGSNAKDFYYAQGESTSVNNLPSGQVNYAGHALYQSYSDVQEGKVNMMADFSSKRLGGAIHHIDGHILANFTGNIHGSQFTSQPEGSLKINGGFYGEHGQEAAATFNGLTSDGKEIQGAFGVKKQ
ncbi:transferrin-binding protein-like solute binding protein, partial [Pasteurellaceae bacterium TAE3-ERU1]|nr:transferrin-binding protein-like solute binding protein [Pasteurellaceae bacterium TAE3-ERU1]